MNLFHAPVTRVRALLHHLRGGASGDALDAKRVSAFVAVSTLFIALLASIGGEWISFATHYYIGDVAQTHSIAFRDQPSGGTVGSAWGTQPAVKLLKAPGVIDTGNNTTIVIQLHITPTTGAAGATLTCDQGSAKEGTTERVSKTVSSGVAAFSGCSIDLANTAGDPYTLTATASDSGGSSGYNGLPATSNSFNVTPGAGGGGGAAPPGPPAPPPAPPAPPPGPPGPPPGKPVGPGGGQVDAGGGAQVDGGVSVNVTPGAFGDTTVNVEVNILVTAPPNAKANPGTTLLDKTIEVNVAAGSGTLAALLAAGAVPLQDPLEVMVNLTAADLAGRTVAVIGAGRADDDGTVTPLPTSVVNAADGVISFTITHLSKFTLFAVTNPGPALTDPANKTQLTSLGATLTWTNPANTRWFQVQVIPFNDDGPGINLIIGDPPQVQAAQYQVKPPDFGGASPSYVMLPGMTYLWQVRSATTAAQPAETDWTAWGFPRLFTTAARTSTGITRVSPEAGATTANLRPTVTWANSDNSVFYYEVQISTDPNFGDKPGAPALWWELAHGALSTPVNSYTVPEQFPLKAGSTYHWRARPRIQGDGDPVPWSAAFSFKTP